MATTYGLHRAMQTKPGSIATYFENRTRTWAELTDRVARFAGALRGLGVQAGDRVAVLMLNQDRYLELFLSCAWAGAVIVPVNTRWSQMEVADCLQDCTPKLLVVDEAFLQMGQRLAADMASFALIYADDAPRPASAAEIASYDELIAQTEPVEDVFADEGALAAIFYTGGTTGRAKGVMLSHRNLIANARNMLAETGTASDETNYLHVAPMFHTANAGVMYQQLLTAGSHSFVRQFSPAGVAQAIGDFKVTDSTLVPTMIQMLVDTPDVGSFDFSSLRRIFYGSCIITESLLDRAMALLEGVEFRQAYGMTELSPCATVLTWKDHIDEGRSMGRHRSAGRPAVLVHVRIVDDEGNELPRGQIGEIVARGETVMMGYWNRPEETEQAIRNGWMHSGDLGYMDEHGYVYVVDRKKDMIISGGENVYPAEVENCISKHPAVAMCAVIGIPDERWGEAVHAVVVPRRGETVDEGRIIAFCKDRIAGYKCPKSVEIRFEGLPLSGAGKVLKAELRKQHGKDHQEALTAQGEAHVAG